MTESTPPHIDLGRDRLHVTSVLGNDFAHDLESPTIPTTQTLLPTTDKHGTITFTGPEANTSAAIHVRTIPKVKLIGKNIQPGETFSDVIATLGNQLGLPSSMHEPRLILNRLSDRTIPTAIIILNINYLQEKEQAYLLKLLNKKPLRKPNYTRIITSNETSSL